MALALCLTLLPTAALAADGAQAADGMGHTHTGATELRMDDKTLTKGGNKWDPESIAVWGSGDEDKETAYALTKGTYYLGSDIEITQYPIMIIGDVTLCLNGKKITCGSLAPDCVIGVYANTDPELTLTDCGGSENTIGTISGGKNAAVKVYGGSTLNMYGGTITGSVDMSGSAEGSPTKFNMSGGTITDGGIGVWLTQSCTFTMSGGTISGNKGGVSTGGTFIMTGGEITGNKATRDGGGVYVNGGTFTMNGGEIKSNTAETNGGGVFVNSGAFTMNGGEIKSNTANIAGGGVFVKDGTFTVSGQPIVSENMSGSANKVTDNVYLPANKTITIGSGLTGGTIGVTTGSATPPAGNSTVAITTATGDAHGYIDYFKSDNDSYYIQANSEETQLELKAKPQTKLTSSNTTITITNADGTDGFVYSGTEITPTVMVTYKGSTDGSKTLNLGTDYTVTSGGSGIDATEYTLTIEGAGDYKGEVQQKWWINKRTVSVSSVTLKDKVYDGKVEGDPNKVNSVLFNDATLTKDVDYTIESVTYDDANAGTRTKKADIVIKLKENGNYAFHGAGESKWTNTVTQTGCTITKAPVNNLKPKPGEINVVNNKADTYTLNLNDLLPTLPDGCEYGEIMYTPVSKTFTLGNYHGPGMSISDDGTTLILPIAAAHDKVDETICTGQVTAKTQNYTDITLFINIKAVAAPPKDPVCTPPTAKTPTYNGQAQELITRGSATGGEMQYRLGQTGDYSTKIPTATNADTYTVYYKVVGNEGYNNIAERSIEVTIAKAQLSGTPTFTKVTGAGKTLNDVTLTEPKDWPKGDFEWGTGATETKKDTQIVQGQAYSWYYRSANHFATGQIVPWANPSSGSGSSSSSSGSYDSNPIIKTETKNNPDGSTTKTETRKDGSVTQTTAKDGSVSKTETKKDGSSVTENKAANGSTGTVKTDKNGQTTAETTLSSKAIEDAKKSGEPVKAPVEVKAARNSGAAPTVKVELPQNAGKTEVEIPVSNANAGTVAVLVRPDGTEEILKDSIPTEDGIRLTVDGSATVKIVDNAKDFIDTQNHWAKDEIDFVSARELVNGISATRYAPDATATRAQLWTILARQNDTDLSGGANWYEKAQLWSKDKGISDGTNPGATITRAQMVTMLWRTMGQPAAGGSASFADVPADSYYAQAVAWAVEGGITQGVGGDRFDPNATCTRAQIAAFLARSMK